MIDKAGKLGTKTSVFWTAFPRTGALATQGYLTAKGWGSNKFGPCGFLLYDQSMTDEDYEELNTVDEDDPPTPAQYALKVAHMSKAFALRTGSGAGFRTVYLLIPDGQTPDPTSI